MSMVGSRIRTLRRAALASTVLVALASAATATAGERTYSFNFSQISLSEALRAYAKITSQQIIFTEDLVSGRAAPVLKGAYTADDALAQLLTNTGLVIERSPSGAIMIRRLAAAGVPQTTVAQATAPGADTAKEEPKDDATNDEDDRKVERVVVTGTHIRGKHPKSSPLDVYTKEDIARTGATTTDQFIQKLPQAAGTRTQYGVGSTPQFNFESVNGVDLRGLGVGTTLTLLNGRRLALGNQGQTADISMLPLSAIDRVEVLTDGASAIYGSDAIGGVVNFVLRKDFDGAETGLSYGGVTSGHMRQGSVTQTVGKTWDGGNALASYDFMKASPLLASDRSYSQPATPGYLSPNDQRQSLIATISQDVGDRLTLNADVLASDRRVKNINFDNRGSQPEIYRNWSDTKQAFVNFDADYALSDTLDASLTASYGEVDVGSRWIRQRIATGLIFRDRNISAYHSNRDITGQLGGTLFELPAGALRFSLGAGYLDEQYSGATQGGGSSTTEFARSTSYAFGELLIPIIAAEHNVPLVHQLELSLAARYTSYDDHSTPALDQSFGGNTSPKVGLLWAPFESLYLRGTYSESFRAPSLTQLDPGSNTSALQGFPAIPYPSGPAGSLLLVNGVSDGLAPETGTSTTLGFDYRPIESTFRLSSTYFSIEYQGRIAQAQSDGLLLLENPTLFPDSIFQPASPQVIEDLLRSSPADFNDTGIDLTDLQAASVQIAALPNFWILDFRLRNLAKYELDGLDMKVSDHFDTGWGRLDLGLQVTRIMSFRDQGTATAPVLSAVDLVLRPADLRARATVGLTQDSFATTVGINYVDDYANPTAVFGPNTVSSWTTVDWNTSYEFQAESGFANGLMLNLSVQNVFDEDPPFVSHGSPALGLTNPVGFDPANANPYGRLIVLGVTKRW